MKQFIRNHTLELSFLVIFILLFFFLGYNKILDLGPKSIHAWRQSDSYSFALTYFYENNKLLEPSLLFTGENGDSRAISEFPILYYITAKIWKLTGITPMPLKFLNFLILLTGLFHLALLTKKILKDNFWAMFVVLFLFSSPILGYYSFNFIPNIPAFGFALTGLYYLYLFGTSGKTSHLVTYTLIFALATLIKVTSLISLLGALFILFSYYLGNFRKEKLNILKTAVSLALIFGTYWLWYSYTIEYNKVYLQGIFNQSVIPIWKLEIERISEIASKFNHYVFPQFFNVIAAYILLAAILAIVLFPGKINVYARRATYIYFLGVISFMLLFFQGLNEHDYFLINSLIVVPAVTIAIILTIKEIYPNIYSSKYSKIIGLFILIFLLNSNMIITRSHYNPHTNWVKYNLPLSKRQKDKWDYNFYVMKYHYPNYQGMHKYLREIGISYENKIITLGDFTPNKTLSLMHQRGFSEYHYSENHQKKEMIDKMIELGAEYLVIGDDKYLEIPQITPFTKNLIGQYNGIKIFKIH